MIDTSKQFPELMSRTERAVRSAFPIESKEHVMSIENVHWENFGPEIMNDPSLHKEYKIKDRTLAAHLVADVTIRVKGGKIVNRAPKFILLTLPHVTNRTSYIVNGNEVQTVNQLRLRPGPYTRFTADDNTETFVNAAGGGYRVIFDRQSGVFKLRSGTTYVPFYPVIKALGITDAELALSWGSDVLAANKKADKPEAVEKLFRTMRRFAETPKSPGDLASAVDSFFRSKEIDPRISKITLGKEYDKITPQLLLDASKKAMALARGRAEADDTESLAFKSIHSVEDFVPEQVLKAIPGIKYSIAAKMDRDPEVKALLSPSTFSDPVIAWFDSSEFTRYSDQQNPLDMAGTNQLTTTLGEGGIQSMHAVTDALRVVHPSHMGLLDPTHSPEGGKIGVTGHLTIGAEKEGNTLYLKVFDAKTGRIVKKSPQELETAVVAFNDQFNLEGARPRAVAAQVKARRRGKIEYVPAKEVEYIFRDPKTFFSVVANEIPFIHNNSPNRVLMADRHIEQAVPLIDPDVPKVQARFKGNMGYDDFFGAASNVLSPVDGTVVKIGKDFVQIKAGPKIHEVKLHYNFPLNGETFLTDRPVVKIGDKVRKDQVIANNNFTKDNSLAIGKSLLTAYLPYKGQNFEDGIVISEGAAKKLTSEHKHEIRLDITPTTVVGLKTWLAHYPDEIVNVDQSLYDASGIIRRGVTIPPNTMLIPAVEESVPHEEFDYAKLHKSLKNPWRNIAEVWGGKYPAEVTDVVKTAKFIKVYLKTQESAQIGDKVSQRSGGKGIIVNIIPDNEMYKDEKGRTIDVLFNPAGVGGRINPGQLFEAAAGKVAENTGKKYLVDNFSPQSTLQKIQNELKENGLSDTEKIFDPVNNRHVENVFVGPIQFMKLQHQVRHKFSAKGIGPYTHEEQPSKITEESAQRIGSGELYALLGSGAMHFLRDAVTLKSQSNPEYWRALQLGLPTPPPKTPFILDKFLTYLQGAGINVVQEGSKFKALPLTDKDVLSRSIGEIKTPGVVRASDLKPETGGLFDKSVTGGFDGTSWTHIDLESPIPNPLMEKAVISVTGLKPAEYKGIMNGLLFVAPDGTLTADPSKGKPTGEGLKVLLKKVDINRELRETIAKIRIARESALDDLNKRRRFLEALKVSGISAPDAYIQSKVAVIPPKFRPIYPLPDGSLNVADPNHGYREVLFINNQLKRLKEQGVDDRNLAPLRSGLYASVQGLTGMTEPLTRAKHFKGFISTIKGRENKFGMFQGRLVGRPQDLSARSTIIPSPSLGLDQVGIPEDMAYVLYKPFIVKGLVGGGKKPTEALEMIEKRDPLARSILDEEIKQRPLYLNRAPTLHRFGMIPFLPTIVSGQAIHINPLIVTGFNADFDGDTMGVHVPISEEARKEAFGLLPSKQLLSIRDDKVIHLPTKEYVLGIYLMTAPKGTPAKAATIQDMLSMYQKKEILVNTPVTVAGKVWTPGQAIINDVFPKAMQPGNAVIDGPALGKLLQRVAKEYPKEAGKIIDKLKDFGGHYVTDIGFSVGLKDLEIDYKKRDQILAEAASKSKRIGFEEAHLQAIDKMQDLVLSNKDSRFVIGGPISGAFKKRGEITQMMASPVAVQDHRGDIIKVPITKSFSEGHDMASYWSTLPGARKTVIEKGLGTQQTGAMSKRLVNTTIEQIISIADCGATDGLEMPVESREALDRVVASGPYKGKVVDPNLVKALVSKRVKTIVVRSPLKCKSVRGICQRCFGLMENGQFPPIGFHIGALAGQTVSEPMMQMMLRTFHSGGAVSRTSVGFDRVEQILEMPDNLPGKATIAMTSGKVDDVKKAPGGGWNVTVDDMNHFVPQERGLAVKKGDKISAGQMLSETGAIKPQELLDATNDIHRVRNQIIDDLNSEFSKGNVQMKRKMFETVIKPMTDRAEVVDAGDGEKYHVYRGDILSVNNIEEINKKIGRGKKIEYRPTLLSVRVAPYHSGDFIGKLMFERPHETLASAPAVGAVSDIKAGHPIAKYVFTPLRMIGSV